MGVGMAEASIGRKAQIQTLCASFLAQYPVFRLEDVREFLVQANGSDLKPVRERSLMRVLADSTTSIRQGLYATTIAPSGASVWPDPYLLAARAFNSSILIREAALRLWLNEPASGPLEVLTDTSQAGWECSDEISTLSFKSVRLSQRFMNQAIHLETIQTVKRFDMAIQVTSRERTLVDVLGVLPSLSSPDECWNLLPRLFLHRKPPLDNNLLMNYLRMDDTKVTAARVGFFLRQHKDLYQISSKTLKEIQRLCPSGNDYREWVDGRKGRRLRSWHLRVPDNILGWSTEFMTETYASLRSDEDLQPWMSIASQAEIDEEEALVDGVEVASALAEEPDDENPGAPGIWDDGSPNPEALDVELESDFTKIHVTPGSGEDLLSLLGERFGYDTFKLGQEELIRAILQGKDAIGILPTGGGKSLIYQYLTMRHGGLTLVISPLLALMDDQMAEATVGNRRLRAGSLNSSMSDDEWNATVHAITSGKLDLLFLAPESLASAWFELKDACDRIKLIVVDEAHCVSAWGHDFRPAYRDLNNLRKLSTRGMAIPILALTATATERVQTDVAAYLRLLNPIVHRESVVRLNLQLSAEMILGGMEPKLKRLDTFLESRRSLQGIIYCATRKGTETVAKHLQKLGMAARAYHAGMPSQERKGVVSSFLAKSTDVVVATIAFGMGINHNQIRYVVHMNLPSSLDGYTQEIGRAGRDSEPADCLLLHSPGDIRFQLFLAGQVPSSIVRLKRNQVWRMNDFAVSSQCRHRGIALHFESHMANCYQGPCGTSCDKCQ